MDRANPGIPDYLPQMSDALRKRAIPDHIIAAYQRRWKALSPEPQALPCPHCFVAGKNGSLSALPKIGDNYYVRCSRCHERILVGSDVK